LTAAANFALRLSRQRVLLLLPLLMVLHDTKVITPTRRLFTAHAVRHQHVFRSSWHADIALQSNACCSSMHIMYQVIHKIQDCGSWRTAHQQSVLHHLQHTAQQSTPPFSCTQVLGLKTSSVGVWQNCEHQVGAALLLLPVLCV
jgi:hypothetical protein